MKYPPRIFPDLLFVGIVWLVASSGCRWREPCDPVSEPYCSLSLFYDGQTVRYEKVYFPQRMRPNEFYDLAARDSLPFSVVSDTTIYVFESPTRRDVVGIGYIRDIHYQMVDCRLVITLRNLRVLPFSTIPADRIDLQTEPRRAGSLFGPRALTNYLHPLNPSLNASDSFYCASPVLPFTDGSMPAEEKHLPGTGCIQKPASTGC